jgi:hypothetical protein
LAELLILLAANPGFLAEYGKGRPVLNSDFDHSLFLLLSELSITQFKNSIKTANAMHCSSNCI